MGKKVILANREDIRNIDAEEQLNFVFSILSQIGLPEDELENCFPSEGEDVDVQQKIRLRKLCAKFRLELIDDMDGGLKIYITQDDGTKNMIAEWKKTWFALRVDHEELDRTKRIFAEVHTEWWTVFEEQDG